MKDLKDYIINEDEQRIDEVAFPVFTPLSNFSPDWQPYIAGLYVLIMLWLGIFFASAGEDVTFGISTLKRIVKGKFKEYKYKRELKEIQNILDKDEDYIAWAKNKKRRLKDLTEIIKKIKDDDKTKQIIKDIWDESKINK